MLKISILFPLALWDSDTKLFNTTLLVLEDEVELDAVAVVVEAVIVVVEEVILIELVVSMSVEGLFNKFLMSFELFVIKIAAAMAAAAAASTNISDIADTINWPIVRPLSLKIVKKN